jgi:hypothetical protein
MPDSKIEILRKLGESPLGLSFKETKEKTKLSDPTVSGGLKSLVLEGLVNFVYPKKYNITTRGQSELKKLEGIQNVENSEASYRKDVMVLMPQASGSLTLRSWPFPFSEQVPINLVLSLGEQRQYNAEDILKEMEERNNLGWTQNFFNDLGRILYEKKGGKRELEVNLKKAPNYKEWIEEVRTKLDMYAVLMVSFDGREIAEKIDWEKRQKEADVWKKQDETERRLLKEVMKQEDSYKTMLENIVMICLNPNDTALTQTELESDLMKRVLAQRNQTGLLPKEPTIEQVREILEDLKKEGSAQTVIKTKYAFTIDEEKLKQRETKNWELLKSKIRLLPKKRHFGSLKGG